MTRVGFPDPTYWQTLLSGSSITYLHISMKSCKTVGLKPSKSSSMTTIGSPFRTDEPVFFCLFEGEHGAYENKIRFRNIRLPQNNLEHIPFPRPTCTMKLAWTLCTGSSSVPHHQMTQSNEKFITIKNMKRHFDKQMVQLNSEEV